MLRLFVSIELPEEIKDALDRLVEESRAQDEKHRLRWARRASFHVTLQFLGNVAEEAVADLSRAIREAAGAVRAMRFSIGQLGTFGGRTPRVLWVGLTGDLDRLSRLVHRIGVALTPLGFPPDRRDHAPHITLARLPRRPAHGDRRLMGEIASGAAHHATTPFEVAEIRLMRSELHPEGSRYTTVKSFPLGGLRPAGEDPGAVASGGPEGR